MVEHQGTFTFTWKNKNETLELVTLIMHFLETFLNEIITSILILQWFLFTKDEDEFSTPVLFHFLIP